MGIEKTKLQNKIKRKILRAKINFIWASKKRPIVGQGKEIQKREQNKVGKNNAGKNKGKF
ncbi:hypothetical protein [Plasmodium yoelii yoelii]|uniref:Uncharacterized protein n=1 Tax=Plasmodium yoelii yoelii TaxID=73239 RepID=Q7RMK5_PLAYO|nr:hypothetical protein [Plasmodium yoelii yoelii]